jgi:hypothetical protein
MPGDYRRISKVPLTLQVPLEIDELIRGASGGTTRRTISEVAVERICLGSAIDPARFGIAPRPGSGKPRRRRATA